MIEPPAATSRIRIREDIARFEPPDRAIAKLAERFEGLTIDGLDDKDGYTIVWEAKKEVRKLRLKVEDVRVALKKDSLEHGRAVDKEAKRITKLLLAIEGPLNGEKLKIDTEREKIKAIEADILQTKLDERVDKLRVLGSPMASNIIRGMDDDAFDVILEQAQYAHDTRAEAEKRDRLNAEKVAEATRVEAQRIADRNAIEAERVVVQREKLAEEEARLKAEREKQKEEFATARKKSIDELAETERKIKAERDEAVAELQERKRLLAVEKEKLQIERDDHRRLMDEKAGIHARTLKIKLDVEGTGLAIEEVNITAKLGEIQVFFQESENGFYTCVLPEAKP